jgi:hypothetical protein
MRSKFKAVRVLVGCCLVFLAFVLPSISLAAAGHWVPFVAQRISKVYEVTPNGKVLIAETSQVWLRDSKGSLYQRNTPVFGRGPGMESATATLFDGTTGTTYMINYPGKMVRTMKTGHPAEPPTPASFHAYMPQNRFIGRRIIDGIECEGWRTKWADSAAHPGGGNAGETWVAPSLDFVPLESVMNDNGMEIDVRVTSIQTGTEPDASLMQIPAGFSVFK